MGEQFWEEDVVPNFSQDITKRSSYDFSPKLQAGEYEPICDVEMLIETSRRYHSDSALGMGVLEALEEELPMSSTSKITVLLIDDNQSVLLQYNRLLEQIAGCTVYFAISGDQALEMMQRYRFSVVFVDLVKATTMGQDCICRLRAWENEVGILDPQMVIHIYKSKNIQMERLDLVSLGFDDAERKEAYKEEVVKLMIAKRAAKKHGQETFQERISDLHIRKDYTGNRNVLVVDDSIIIRKIYEQRLVKMGMTVYTAENGEEALAYLKKIKFLIVFMDLQMPVMGGEACIRALRDYERKMGVERQYVVAVFSSDTPSISNQASLLSDANEGISIKTKDKLALISHIYRLLDDSK